MITITMQPATSLRVHGGVGTWRERVRPSVFATTDVVLAGTSFRANNNSIAATAAVSAYVTDGPATDAMAVVAADAKPAAPPRGVPR